MSDLPAPPAVPTRRRHVLYPNHYAWYVLVASLDIIVTHTVLHRFGGKEVNTVAARLIERFDLWGLIGLKFLTVVIVVTICEIIGRRRETLGRRVAEWATAISAIPVAVALAQIFILSKYDKLPVQDPDAEMSEWVQPYE